VSNLSIGRSLEKVQQSEPVPVEAGEAACFWSKRSRSFSGAKRSARFACYVVWVVSVYLSTRPRFCIAVIYFVRASDSSRFNGQETWHDINSLGPLWGLHHVASLLDIRCGRMAEWLEGVALGLKTYPINFRHSGIVKSNNIIRAVALCRGCYCISSTANSSPLGPCCMTLHIAGVKLSKALGIQDRFLKSDRQGISTRQID